MPDELEEEIESALLRVDRVLGILAATAADGAAAAREGTVEIEGESENSSFFLLPKSDMANF